MLLASGPLCAQIEIDTVQNVESSSYFDSVQPEHYGPVETRKISDSVVQRLKLDDAYWYANLAPEKEINQKVEQPSGQTIFQKQWFKTVIWILILGVFITVLIFYLASSNIRLFRKASTVIRSDEDPLTEEDIFTLNFEKEIQSAISKNNYRLATRLMYLQTLKILSDKELIQFRHERTNSDYLFQLSGTPYYKNFFRLTRDFDYTWYGHFPLTEDSFSNIQKDFTQFKLQLQS
jgi:hypothetical protein